MTMVFRKNIHGHNRTQVELVSPFGILLRFLLCPFRFFQLSCIVLWFLRRHYINIAFFVIIVFVEIIARAAIKYQVLRLIFNFNAFIQLWLHLKLESGKNLRLDEESVLWKWRLSSFNLQSVAILYYIRLETKSCCISQFKLTVKYDMT